MKLKSFLSGILIIVSFDVFGQSLSIDSISSTGSIFNSNIIIPAYYVEICKKPDLPTMDLEKDSFSFRLWTSSMTGYQMMIFKKNGDDFISKKYKYTTPNSFYEVKVNPKMDFKQFYNGLKSFDFNVLIPQISIPGFEDNVDDGISYTLEIILNKSYKVVRYHSPQSFSDSDNKHFSKFILLISKYFDE